MDLTIYEGSKIARLPSALRPLAILARETARGAIFSGGRYKAARYSSDGISTVHNPAFLANPRFRQAYARAVKAGGWDYGIQYRVHQALWCAGQALKVEGAFVELGTGRGFVMSALLEDGVTRPVHLFDTFLPNDVEEGAQTGAVMPVYASSVEGVKANFAEWSNVSLHPGDVFETLPAVAIDQVAFLHVDLNYAKAEEFGIRHLWPRMPKGAVMLMDDFAFSGYEANHEALRKLTDELGVAVLTTPTGQGIVIK